MHVVSTDVGPVNKEIGEARLEFYGVNNVEFHTADACDLSQWGWLPSCGRAQMFDAASACHVLTFVSVLRRLFMLSGQGRGMGSGVESAAAQVSFLRPCQPTLQDLPLACRELHRVLKPGAPLVATVWQEEVDMFKVCDLLCRRSVPELISAASCGPRRQPLHALADCDAARAVTPGVEWRGGPAARGGRSAATGRRGAQPFDAGEPVPGGHAG